ncbi:BgTH12-07409 [Blumeria graminis f. sp. triticale]|uniref:BgTH12-07409 n=1 Tax=Blumeria graminis f. sp. triticale TaxID=1689686 RepID=A0A9W4GD10_BLUGR|nr:BgTH12-07409 [Blumeria graminis f. sp. triticale]
MFQSSLTFIRTHKKGPVFKSSIHETPIWANSMTLSQKNAKWLASLSFVANFFAQLYGMLATPNMKDIHDANLSFWSPQPILVLIIFIPQLVLQLTWQFRLWKIDSQFDADKFIEVEQMVDYVPYYALGNLCIAIWMIFWKQADLKTANLFVMVNSFTQLYYVFGRLPPMEAQSISSILTYAVSTTLAGIGILDLLHNGSVAYFDHQGPNLTVKILTLVFFIALVYFSDWLLGACLVYDLVALAIGQWGIGQKSWGMLLGVYALGTAFIVILQNFIRPSYFKKTTSGYTTVPNNESDLE